MPGQGQAASTALAGVAHSPIRFEQVQAGAAPVFLARGFNYQFCLAPTRATLAVQRPLSHAAPAAGQVRGLSLSSPQLVETRSISMSFPGANAQPRMEGQEPVPGTTSYILGNDPAQWRTGGKSFEKVAVENLYPGINLVYYGNQRRLEYDFILAPGAHPEDIAVQFTGADQVSIDGHGELVLTIGSERITHPRPALFQQVDGARRLVTGGYRQIDPHTIGFQVGKYDQASALIIDPILSYSSLFGGDSGDLALAVKLDSEGFIYVAGETLSSAFPLPLSGFETNFGGGKINGDAFVAKFDPLGSALVYFTYLGGRGNDGALDLAVDSAGHAHVCGFTDSPDFPTTANALHRTITGHPTPGNGIYQADVFITELDASGQALVYSSYFGGTNADRADAIALDSAGNTYITGVTYSQDFQLLNPLRGQTNLHGAFDAFVAKFGPVGGGADLIYSTFLGGTNADEGQGIAVDADGSAYVTGLTASTNFPTTLGAFRTNLNGYVRLTPLFDAFVTKINPDGRSLAYSTLLGGTNSDSGFRIAVDSGGSAFVTGSTMSLDFPNTATNLGLSTGFTNVTAANNDAFLSKLNPDGSLAWSVRFGGLYADVGWDVALDQTGDPFVVGTTSSTNFPVFNDAGFPLPSKTKLGYESVFVTAVKQDASAVMYSLLMGGSHNDRGYGITVDPAGNAYIVGKVTSTNFPLVGPLQSTRLGTNDTFLAKIALEPILQTAISGQSLEVKWRAFAPEFALERNDNSQLPSGWVPVPATPLLSNGWHTVRIDPTNTGGFYRLRVR